MSASPYYRMQFMICAGTGCIASGSMEVMDALQKELEKRHLQDDVQIITTGCNGFCAMGPLVVTYPDGVFYNQVKPEHAPLIVEEHVLKGRVVQELLFKEEAVKDRVPLMKDIGFFGQQRLIVLRNRGLIDAENIDEYIARDGYAALGKALEEMTPEQVIEEVKKSGLRGRGGGGFPTGLKWEECAKYESFPKYTICNGDEGDPGAFMDRSVMEGDPHSVLEGMAISGYAIGAEKGYIYVRAEYPLAIERLQKAINDAREYGLLGKDILGKGFDFDIEIYPGAGAFVCGESTALMFSIEGKRGMPRIKPPRSAEAGLWNQPTNLNNVETFANLNPLILNGGDWFASIGTEGSKGTKVFALTGAIQNVGLVEVPMGTSLKTLIFDIGGGIPKKREFKAAQIGGPSGGCIPNGMEDVQIDYESLYEAGAMMGSGGVVVMDNMTCMVDTAKFFTHFCVDESCGKCIPCREGLKVMLEKLTDICEGRGQEGDVEFLIELGHHINNTSHCGLGKSAANPVLSTIRYFRHEYDAHIRDKHCDALVCPDLIDFVVMEDKCKKCGLCHRNCPSGAIIWEKKQVARIDLDKCTRCRTCIMNCRFGAIR